jgi:hypothetical protein
MPEQLLQTEYVTSIEEVLWGGTLVGVTMVLHGLGMIGVLRANQAVKDRFGGKKSLIRGLIPLILMSWSILLVHLVEVLVWALFFLWKGAFANRSVAYYFSLNEYTTVGSDYNLPSHWRLLEGMIATAGLLAFAWSTGIFITLAQEFQDQHIRPRAKAGRGAS